MANKVLPENPRRILLVNPTKYLGNLLLAGGLMQDFADYCHGKGIALHMVLDESFRELCENSFPDGSITWFPRRAIKGSGVFKKISLYRQCLAQIRRFKADIAFNVEEDSATSHLTRLSGAAFRVGCSPARHKGGYDLVLPLQFENRDAQRMHRWYSFYDVFAALGMPQPEKSYIRFSLPSWPDSLEKKLGNIGWDPQGTTIALHAGATKQYKKWPVQHWAALVEKITQDGMQAVLLGAGADDAAINERILGLLRERGLRDLPLDLCNQLSLVELAQFLSRCTAMVGNDSGPFHLGSALGIPGLVLWGPTNKDIWGPLGAGSEIVQGSFPCDPACNKGSCLHDHRCLREISPDQVFKALAGLGSHS